MWDKLGGLYFASVSSNHAAICYVYNYLVLIRF